MGLDQSTVNGLIKEIASLIVEDIRYTDDRWISIAVVGNLSHGQLRMNGYQYFADGDYSGGVPRNSDILFKMETLREEMKKDKGREWHQCLVHITKPDFEIDIQFEYDDPDRWTRKQVSLDMSAYAELLRPKQSVN